MSSRQEEKEQRRREREEAERRSAAAGARTRRLQIVGGVILGVAIIAVAVVLITGSGGGDGGGGGAQASGDTAVTLPAREINDLDAAAEAGQCTVKGYPIEGRTHTTKPVTYKTNPPTSGDHNPTPAEDGVYEAGNTPEPGALVHSLEHGRVQLQYKPDSPPKTVDTLTAIFNEEVNGTPGYHALLFENATGMEAPVAATAWGQMITCPDLNAGAIDALRAFRDQYTDKGPEFIP